MADRIYLPRALDANGDVVANATAYFYEDGTSTPLEVFAEEALSTSLGTSEQADSEGVFPACWVASGTGVKVDIQDSGGTSLPGYPDDDNGRFPSGGNAASAITHTPQTGNTATDVQAALNNNTSAINVLEELTQPVVATGSGGSYVIAANVTISGYETGQIFAFFANHDAVGGGSDTLNVDGQGAVVIKKRAGGTAKSDLAANDLHTGDTVIVVYDGSHFAIISQEREIPDDDDLTVKGVSVARRDNVVAHVGRIAAGQLSVTASSPSWDYQTGFNASITDNGTGNYTLAFDAAEPDTNYLISFGATEHNVRYANKTVNGFDILAVTATGSSAVDPDEVSIIVTRLP